MRLIIGIGLTALLAGCSWIFGEDGLFPDNADRYQTAPELAPIDVPAHLSTDAIQPDYPVPAVAASAQLATQFETPRPTPLTANNQADAVRIQSLVGERWALVSVAPGQLWPQVRGFLTTSGIGVAAVDAEAGLIDTQWVKLEDRELAVRFRFRVDTGVQRNTAELHVLQQTRGVEDASWPGESDDRDLEKKMLEDVAQYLANSAESAPISMMADRAMSDSGRITLEDTETTTRIRLELPFDRAWASVVKGTEAADFAIDDRDRSQGILYVTFVGPQEEDDSGWFDWLWGGEDDHPLAGHRYQIRLDNSDQGVVLITLLGPEGEPIERREQQALLTILRGNIT
ncbi:MAG: outer membrane protein assembly factor BamC [Luminiphilus sp.]|jgi:outer membrane protein assembly factor BamC|nr:outer membrane protein assembly factor BamC [Luminiphilus sp.]